MAVGYVTPQIPPLWLFVSHTSHIGLSQQAQLCMHGRFISK